MSTRAGFVAAGALLASGVIWVIRLLVAPGYFADSSGALLGLAILVAASVAALGIVLSRGKWARRLGFVVLAGQVALLVTMDLDGWGWACLVVTAAALVLTAGPWLDGFLRKLPPADGPSLPAILLALGFVLTPAAVALSAPAGLSAWHWLAAVSITVIGWSYSRAHLAGLWAARLGAPVFLVVAALASPPGGLALLVGVAAVLGALAWAGGTARAVMPIEPRPGRGVAVPPQLVPADVLARAGYDERGRRIENHDG